MSSKEKQANPSGLTDGELQLVVNFSKLFIADGGKLDKDQLEKLAAMKGGNDKPHSVYCMWRKIKQKLLPETKKPETKKTREKRGRSKAASENSDLDDEDQAAKRAKDDEGDNKDEEEEGDEDNKQVEHSQ